MTLWTDKILSIHEQKHICQSCVIQNRNHICQCVTYYTWLWILSFFFFSNKHSFIKNSLRTVDILEGIHLGTLRYMKLHNVWKNNLLLLFRHVISL